VNALLNKKSLFAAGIKKVQGLTSSSLLCLFFSVLAGVCALRSGFCVSA
jgi:hypothetical protein